MARYVTRDGLVLEGETAIEVIDSLRRDSFSPGRDRSEFLRSLAEGAEMQTGKRVRPTDCETALADLIAAGLVELMN